MPTEHCFSCEEETFKHCLLCQKPFCPNHAADDDDYCCECLASTPDIISAEPLINDEGQTVNNGRLLRPVGDKFITSAGSISSMSDEKLKLLIGDYKLLVKEAQESLDRRRVILTMAQTETSERERERLRKWRSVKIPVVTAEGKTVTLSGRRDAASKIIEKLKAAGLTKEMAQAMLDKLNAKTTGGGDGNTKPN